jgi:hypothetical protein
MAKEKNIRCKLPGDFSDALDNWIAELKENGIKKTKSQLVVTFAMIGFIQENRNKKTTHEKV